VTEGTAGEERGPEVYDYPGEFTEGLLGERLAGVRLQELRAYRRCAVGGSTCARFLPGRRFTLAAPGAPDREVLLIEVTHGARDPGARDGRHAPARYGNSFVAVPADAPLRPRRVTRRPSVAGVETAVVVGPPGEEVYVDRYGRVRVRFPWDRGERGEAASCCAS